MLDFDVIGMVLPHQTHRRSGETVRITKKDEGCESTCDNVSGDSTNGHGVSDLT